MLGQVVLIIGALIVAWFLIKVIPALLSMGNKW